jgi:hypothetical protein
MSLKAVGTVSWGVSLIGIPRRERTGANTLFVREQQLDPRLGFVQPVRTESGQAHTLFKDLERSRERELATFEVLDHLGEAREDVLEGRIGLD